MAESQTATFEVDDRLTHAERSSPTDHRDRLIGSVILLNDVTEHRARQAELKRQKERLEEFSSMVSHDLRNPLTVAKGQLELGRQESDNEHCETAGRALDRMVALISELRTLARSGQLIETMEPVSLADLSRECWQLELVWDPWKSR